MKAQNELLESMLEGFDSLEDFSNRLDLSLGQRAKLSLQKLTVALYRTFVLPFRRKRMQGFKERLQQIQNIGIEIPDHGLSAGPDNHYLNSAELEDFKRSGILKPFRVVSAGRAEALRQAAYAAHETDYDGTVYLGEEVREVLERHGQWNINKSGMFQALSMKEFRDLIREPALAERLASILGPDVICWRTQFIEKNPGDQGTFWHQNSAFQESSKARKLTPTEETSMPIVQLTMWMALTDVRVDTAAMRMLPGSFKDARLEAYYELAATHLMDFLALLDRKHLDFTLKAANFATYEFTKAQAIFMAALDQFEGMFDGREVVDLTMKAGEAAIFTSLNMHSSYANSSQHDSRFAFIGRFTANSVKVYHNMPEDKYPSPEGNKPFSTAHLSCIQVHGEDRYGHNRIFQEPEASKSASERTMGIGV